jgi:hypothetical protein
MKKKLLWFASKYRWSTLLAAVLMKMFREMREGWHRKV